MTLHSPNRHAALFGKQLLTRYAQAVLTVRMISKRKQHQFRSRINVLPESPSHQVHTHNGFSSTLLIAPPVQA
jgi:hypothetical protein